MRILLLVVLLGLGKITYGQTYYYYKPWKNVNLDNKEIVLTIDSVKSDDGKKFIVGLANMIADRLNTLGHKCSVTDVKSSSNDEALVIKLSLLKPEYVKLKALYGQIPLCNRVTFEQTKPMTGKMINTVINISVDKQDEAITPLVDDLTKRLDKQLTKD